VTLISLFPLSPCQKKKICFFASSRLLLFIRLRGTRNECQKGPPVPLSKKGNLLLCFFAVAVVYSITRNEERGTSVRRVSLSPPPLVPIPHLHILNLSPSPAVYRYMKTCHLISLIIIAFSILGCDGMDQPIEWHEGKNIHGSKYSRNGLEIKLQSSKVECYVREPVQLRVSFHLKGRESISIYAPDRILRISKPKRPKVSSDGCMERGYSYSKGYSGAGWSEYFKESDFLELNAYRTEYIPDYETTYEKLNIIFKEPGQYDVMAAYGYAWDKEADYYPPFNKFQGFARSGLIRITVKPYSEQETVPEK